MSLPIPESHLDVLTRPIHGVLTTMLPDGQPHSSLVWCDYDGLCARVNTTRQREKGRNMLANPKVSLLVVDPQNTARYLEIRGEAELIEEGALDHLDQLTRHYTHHPHHAVMGATRGGAQIEQLAPSRPGLSWCILHPVRPRSDACACRSLKEASSVEEESGCGTQARRTFSHEKQALSRTAHSGIWCVPGASLRASLGSDRCGSASTPTRR
jgi:PPOX class probable F420-dependent enzyme